MTTDEGAAAVETDLLAAVTELGEAVRALVDASVRTTVDAVGLRATAGAVREATAGLFAARRPASRLRVLDDPVTFRRVCSSVTGVGSAIAPPLVSRRQGDDVVAEAALGLAYEGPPGYLHGG